MDLKKPLLDVVKKAVVVKIDLKALSHGVIDEVLEPALKEVVADSTNTFDDMALAMLLPTLDAKLKELLDKKLAEAQTYIDEQLGKVLA